MGGIEGWLNQFCHIQVTVNETEESSYLSINFINFHFQRSTLRVNSEGLMRKYFHCNTTRKGAQSKLLRSASGEGNTDKISQHNFGSLTSESVKTPLLNVVLVNDASCN